jgi:hypothetical protein
MDAHWRKALAQSIGLPKAERTLAKARRNFWLAKLIARVNPSMRGGVEETRKSMEFWSLMVAEMRAA